MKKLLSILFIAGLIACGNDNTVTITKDQLKALTKDSTTWELSVDGESYPVVKGNDGHEYYLMYIATGGYTGRTRPFHLPGCKLCNKVNKALSPQK